jgi:hypothetical protein
MLANGSRERAPDDKLRVIRHATRTGGGLRLAPSLVELPRTGSANCELGSGLI